MHFIQLRNNRLQSCNIAHVLNLQEEVEERRRRRRRRGGGGYMKDYARGLCNFTPCLMSFKPSFQDTVFNQRTFQL